MFFYSTVMPGLWNSLKFRLLSYVACQYFLFCVRKMRGGGGDNKMRGWVISLVNFHNVCAGGGGGGGGHYKMLLGVKILKKCNLTPPPPVQLGTEE